MKKVLLGLSLAVLSTLSANAYTTVVVRDSISTNTHWTCDKQYLLQGYVYVTAGASLTIDSGVIIKGDKDTKGTLIVERGAQLHAMGTRNHPVVFTSNQPAGARSYGDWGGVILCGNAPVNWTSGQGQVEGGPRSFYGGTNPADNSGEMHFCRIEFGGVAFSPNNEVNGLTFCGVGSATQIDHIQVSYSGDDSYEWFGGAVNSKYMVALAGWDDDFDTDNGYVGLNQFMVGLRDPYAADQSGSKAFESDSYQSGTATGLSGDTSHITKPVFSNCTIIGPLVNPGSTAYDPQFVACAQIRRGSAISILNSILCGYPAGLLIDESSSSFGSTVANIGNGVMQFRNNIIAGMATSTSFNKDVVFVKDGARSLTSTSTIADTTSSGTNWLALTNNGTDSFSGPYNWLHNRAFKNVQYTTEQTGVRLSNPFNLTNPGMVPTSTSPVVYNSTHFASWGTGVNDVFNPSLPISYDTTSPSTYNVPGVAPDFSTSKAANAFFDRVNYVGAFPGTGRSTDNWMYGWCNFDPLNENYDITCYTADTSHLAVGAVYAPVSTFAKVYPNPAEGSATIALDVNHTSVVKVEIYDMSGRSVMQVCNNNLNAGSYTFDISTVDMKPGNYVISILSDEKHKILKFVIK